MKFPSAKDLGKRLGTSEKGFHKKIKPDIVQTFKKELNKKGIRNPDIGVDGAGNIVLKKPGTNIEIRTDLKLDTFKLD